MMLASRAFLYDPFAASLSVSQPRNLPERTTTPRPSRITPRENAAGLRGMADRVIEYARLEGSHRVRGKSPTHLHVRCPGVRAMTSCSLIADPRLCMEAL